MAFCEQCGNKLGENAKFCGKCGTPVPAGQAEAPSAGTSGNGEDPALKAFNAGLASIEAERYDEAIAHFTVAIMLNPNYEEAYYERASAHAGKMEYDSAIDDYTTALRLAPENAATYYFRGLAYLFQENIDSAIADFTQAIRLNPNEADFYCSRGLAYSAISDFDTAIADYSKAIQLRPDSAEVYGSRGVVYAEKGDLANARADLERGLQIDPNDGTVLQLAEIIKETGGQGGMSAPTACAQCGAPLEEGEAFCSNCGAKVGAAAQYRPAPVQAQRQAAGGHVEKHIIMMIEDVFLISGRGTVVTGKVENVVRLNEKVIIVGENFEKMSVVTGIEMFNKDLDKAVPGDNVGLFLKSIKKNEIKRGYYVKFAPNA